MSLSRGGSAADNTVEGHWQQFANGQLYRNTVVTAMFPSVPTYLAFHSGYSATERWGKELILTSGTRASLISRAGRVAQAAMDSGRVEPDEISGGFAVYCTGCMLTVKEQMPEVASELQRTLDGKPFIGTFTFGEQGCFVGARITTAT